MQQCCGHCQPIAMHLVTAGVQFETIVGRTNGTSWCFDKCDRHVGYLIAEQLQQHLQ
ncbi:MAG: hypothetical protein N2235_17270 [Fischerella sp.]|nr:hypothetical protein [Fischerella sp.]